MTNATTFSVTLNAADKLAVNGLLNKDGATSDSGTTYNLAAADNWMAGGAPNNNIQDLTLNGVTVSNYTAPAVTSATYNCGTAVLTVTGSNFTGKVGALNDIDSTKLVLTGEGGNTHTLTAANVEVTNDTTFSIALAMADRLIVNGLLNKDGTQADDGATNYNLSLLDNYLQAGPTSVDIADATNGVTVSGVVAPTINFCHLQCRNQTAGGCGDRFEPQVRRHQ